MAGKRTLTLVLEWIASENRISAKQARQILQNILKKMHKRWYVKQKDNTSA
jgi:hypothetical protein